MFIIHLCCCDDRKETVRYLLVVVMMVGATIRPRCGNDDLTFDIIYHKMYTKNKKERKI